MLPKSKQRHSSHWKTQTNSREAKSTKSRSTHRKNRVNCHQEQNQQPLEQRNLPPGAVRSWRNQSRQETYTQRGEEDEQQWKQSEKRVGETLSSSRKEEGEDQSKTKCCSAAQCSESLYRNCDDKARASRKEERALCPREGCLALPSPSPSHGGGGEGLLSLCVCV